MGTAVEDYRREQKARDDAQKVRTEQAVSGLVDLGGSLAASMARDRAAESEQRWRIAGEWEPVCRKREAEPIVIGDPLFHVAPRTYFSDA